MKSKAPETNRRMLMPRPSARAGGLRTHWGTVSAAIVLVAGGWAYRLTAAALNDALGETIPLERPLSTLAVTIGSWQGKDVEPSEAILRVAGNDDSVSRHYRNTETGEVISLDIGYTPHPRTMLQHRPTICYPSAGWSHVRTNQIDVLAGALRLPALMHCFVKPGLNEARCVVVNYYVFNGEVTISEDDFWGVGWRNPRVERGTRRYVAQIQIAATAGANSDAAEQSVRRFAAESAPEILSLLPGALDRLRAPSPVPAP